MVYEVESVKYNQSSVGHFSLTIEHGQYASTNVQHKRHMPAPAHVPMLLSKRTFMSSTCLCLFSFSCMCMCRGYAPSTGRHVGSAKTGT